MTGRDPNVNVLRRFCYPGCQSIFSSLGATELTGREGESRVSRRQALLALTLDPRRWRARRPLASKVRFRWGQKALLLFEYMATVTR